MPVTETALAELGLNLMSLPEPCALILLFKPVTTDNVAAPLDCRSTWPALAWIVALALLLIVLAVIKFVPVTAKIVPLLLTVPVVKSIPV